MATVNFQLNCAVYSCNIPQSLQLIGSIDPLHLTSVLTHGMYRKIYLVLKINYKINMHLIDFKIAHIKVQALAYLLLFAK